MSFHRTNNSRNSCGQDGAKIKVRSNPTQLKDNANGTDNGDSGTDPDRNIPLASGVPLGATIRYKVELVGTSNSLTLNATFNNPELRSRKKGRLASRAVSLGIDA